MHKKQVNLLKQVPWNTCHKIFWWDPTVSQCNSYTLRNIKNHQAFSVLKFMSSHFNLLAVMSLERLISRTSQVPSDQKKRRKKNESKRPHGWDRQYFLFLITQVYGPAYEHLKLAVLSMTINTSMWNFWCKSKSIYALISGRSYLQVWASIFQIQ